MAYTLTLEQIYPSSFRGTAEVMTAKFYGLPSSVAFGLVDDLVAVVVGYFPPGGLDELLRIRIWEDTEPLLDSRYRLEVVGHGSPIPWALIIAALVALAIIWGITWTITSTPWGVAFPIAAVAIAAAAVVGLSIWAGRKR